MGEKGVTSIVVIAIIIIIAAVGVSSYFLLKGGEGLPVYPGATLSEFPESWSEMFAIYESHGISVSAYTTGANSDEVLDWYRSEMSERGWSKILDNTFDNYHCLSFQKGNEAAGVSENNGTLILMQGTIEQIQAATEELCQELQVPGSPVLALVVAAEAIDNMHVEITLFHREGEDLRISDLMVIAADENGENHELELDNEEILSAGEYIKGVFKFSDEIQSGDTTSLKVVHNPSQKVLLNAPNVMIVGVVE